MDADGYKWMQMGAIGCMRQGDNAKQHRQSKNVSAWGYLTCMTTTQKQSKSARMTAASREVKWGAFSGKLGIQE